MEELKSQFIKSLSKFKVSEFPAVMDFVFGDELRWEEVKRTADEKRIQKRARSLAELCCVLYWMTKPTKEDAINKIWMLQLSDIALHSQRTWFGLKLTDPFPDSEPSWDDIEQNIVTAYRNDLRSAEVNTLIGYGNLLYIMVVEEKITKKTKKSNFLSPIFFVYNTELSTPYAFFTPKPSKSHPLHCFSAAVGYQNYDLLKLSGQDVNSLYGMVQRKMAGTVALRPPPFIPEPIQCGGYVRDLTGYLHREEYARKILNGHTNLKKFTVQSCNEWRGTSVIPSLSEDVPITSKLTIQTTGDTDVEDVLRHLMVRGNISIPPPAWVLNLANRPRNEVTLHFGADGSGPSAQPRRHSSNICSEEDEPMES